MIRLEISRISAGRIDWNVDRISDDRVGIVVVYQGYMHESANRFSSQERAKRQGEYATRFAKILSEGKVGWIKPSAYGKRWTIDLDRMRRAVPGLESEDWALGIVRIKPKFTIEPNSGSADYKSRLTLFFQVFEDQIASTRMNPVHGSFVPEIKESLARFRKVHPDPTKVGFIMMQFGDTAAHKSIADAIRATLKPHGIKALRADERQYHDDLFPNVLTYIYGCGFGIAVFERLEDDAFNPNVSLEVGYMLALRKPICLLKDKTLKGLQSDLVGKLYRPFDPQNPMDSIPPLLESWTLDKGIIAERTYDAHMANWDTVLSAITDQGLISPPVKFNYIINKK